MRRRGRRLRRRYARDPSAGRARGVHARALPRRASSASCARRARLRRVSDAADRLPSECRRHTPVRARPARPTLRGLLAAAGSGSPGRRGARRRVVARRGARRLAVIAARASTGVPGARARQTPRMWANSGDSASCCRRRGSARRAAWRAPAARPGRRARSDRARRLGPASRVPPRQRADFAQPVDAPRLTGGAAAPRRGAERPASVRASMNVAASGTGSRSWIRARCDGRRVLLAAALARRLLRG